jgi:predicted outer membrane repeat protein
MSARPHLEAFEPRLLYSADALSLAMSLSAGDFSGTDAAWTQPVATAASQQAVATQGAEIVVLDTSVADSASLLADLLAQQRAGRPLEVLTLNAGDDGIARITELLAQRNNISALHLLGHGADGLVLLGGSQLNSATLLARAGEVASWGRAFSADADFLIYGCDVAAGATGQQLVNDLATITGTDVAASTDATASSLRGGNWLLEDQTGQIETTLALSTAAQQSYSGSLATILVTRFTDDNDPGSLRWAITQANVARSADTITLSAGTYVLSLSNAGITPNSWRDFDIESDVTIVGAGPGQTVINSLGGWRHFEVNSGSLNLSGVTLRGGSQTTTDTNSEESRGGSINVRAGATLVLGESVIENSSAQNGGAIYVSGTATLTDVELRNNAARNDGGAIYNTGSLSLSRVTVANNTAADDGGGIYQSAGKLLTLTNVTLSGNQAQQHGGGMYASAAVAMINVSVVNNLAGQNGSTLGASGDGGGVYVSSGGIVVAATNSLFAGNVDGDGDVSHSNRNLTSAGNNLIEGQSGILPAASDRIVADVKLASLAANGGFGRTHALLSSSPAVNAANSTLAPSTDQRGTARQGSADIGAFEYLNAAPAFADISLTIGAGGNASPLLSIFDPESDGITVNVVTKSRGFFAYDTDLATEISSFDYSDSYNGRVRFVHDGSATAPTFTLRASDAQNAGTAVTGTVYFTPPNTSPVATALTLASSAEDTARVITQAQLLNGITDANGDPVVALNLQLVNSGNGSLAPKPNATSGTGPITSANGFGVGTGLKGEYYNNVNFASGPALTRTEAVDFNWARSAPNAALPNDNFSVNWTGYVVPPSSGNYVFRTESDDGIRVWVNNVLVINAWSEHSTQADVSNTIALQANTAYAIRVAYFESTGAAIARLQWQTPGGNTYSAIPAARLFSTVPTAPNDWTFTPTTNSNGTVNFSYSVSDGRGGLVANTASMVVTPVNDAPTITSNKLTLNESEIATPQIVAFDADFPALSTLRFTASNVTHGHFAFAATPSSIITSFTQAELNANDVRFVHDGSGLAPTYRLVVKDAGNLSSAFSTPAVEFTAVNDAPVFVTNSLNVVGGESALPVIVVSDEDNSATQLTFTVTNLIGGGFVLRTGVASNPVASFTQQEVDDGRVSFVHDGTATQPSYRLTVSDGSGGSVGRDATVEFNNLNATPVLGTNRLTLSEGDVATPVISATDNNDNALRLTITASEVTGGYFAHKNDLNFEVASFTQLDVNDDLIRFVHDNKNAKPSYRLTVNDPSGATATSLADVSFTPVNDAPVIVVNALSITQGGSALPWIEATDEEGPVAALTFTVSNLSGGRFELINAESADVLQFTQAQVDNGDVRFVANGSALAPAYTLTVSDGSAISAPVPVNIISFTALNDRPVFTQNSLTISEGDVAKPSIRISDANNSSDQLLITVSGLRGGYFELMRLSGGPVIVGELRSVVEEVVDSFTLAQVKAGEINFVHDGSEQAPSYTLTVTDTDGATDTSVLSDVDFTSVNDLPYFEENALVIREGGMAVPNIKVIDADNVAVDLRLSVTEVSGGRFELTSNAGQAITSFTQSQIDKGQVRFVDSGQGTAPTYILVATDPALLLSGNRVNVPRSVGSVTFTAVNDAPVFTSNGLEVTEGGVAKPSINVTDEDNDTSQITITASNVSGGRFEFINAKDVAITSFTQADMDAGNVRFVHDGSSTAPRYTLTATDTEAAQRSSTLSNVNFTAVNDKPVFAVNALNVTEGGVAVPVIQVTDEDNSASELRFSASALVGGRLELTSAPGVAITQFTQAQLDAGAVRFVHDGSETVPGYALSVSDVEGAQATSAGPATAYTPVNDAPVILSNRLRITEAGFAVPNIKTTDVDTAAAQLKFTVSAVSSGYFELASAPGVGLSTFTQAQLDADTIRFVHDGSFDAPRYSLALSDGDTVLNSDAAVTFTRLPPPPPAVVVITTNAPATTNASATTTATTTAAKPTSTSAADVLASRAAAAEMAAAEAAMAEAQAHANSQATASSNSNAAASSSNANDARDSVSRGTTSASTNNTAAGVEVDARWATATVAAGAVNVQNLLLSGDTNALDWSSSSNSLLDRKLLDAVLGSSDSSVRNTALDKAFERIREELDQGAQADGQAVAGSLVLSTSFSVGYVLWLARGGVLLASMASTIPAWATVDPLPVLSRFKARQGEGDDGFGGPDGEPNAEKADALERLFSKAKRVFSGNDSVPVEVPAAVAPTPIAATPVSTVPKASQASGVTP